MALMGRWTPPFGVLEEVRRTELSCCSFGVQASGSLAPGRSPSETGSCALEPLSNRLPTWPGRMACPHRIAPSGVQPLL